MKEEIQGIVKAISQLSPPFIPYELKKIFAPLYALKNSTLPPEFTTLNALVEAQSELYGTKAQIKGLREKQVSLTAKIIDIQEQLQGSDSVKSSIEPIIASINEYLINHDLAPVTLPINLQNKETKEQVERYLKHIKVLIVHLEAQEQLTLVDDLAMVQVICTRESSTDKIQQIIKKIQLEVDRLTEVCPRIDSIIQQLLVTIPATDAPKKRQLIKVALERVNIELERKQTDIETFTDLDYFEKDKLTQQADKTFFNPDLIKYYSDNKSTSSTSSWLPSFAMSNNSKSPESLYLELLNEKNELTLKKATLDLLNELLDPSNFNPLKTNMAECVTNLIKEARDSFATVNQSLVSLLPETAANADVFNLAHMKTLLNVRVKQKEYIFDTLGKLLAIKQNMPPLDKATPTALASDVTLDEGIDKDNLIEHRALCLSFLKGLEILEPLFAAQQEKVVADAKLKSLGSLESTNERIAANDRRIENAIRRIRELAPSTINENEDNPKVAVTNATPALIEKTDTGRESPFSPIEDEDGPPSPVLLPLNVNLKKVAALNSSTEDTRDTPVASPSPVTLPEVPMEQDQSTVRNPIAFSKLKIDSGPSTFVELIPEPQVLTQPSIVSPAPNDPPKVQAVVPPNPAVQHSVASNVVDKEPPPPKDTQPTDSQLLMFWHQQNLDSLRKGSEKMFLWYVGLYQEVELYLKRNPSCYRPYHLINDIFQDIHHRLEGQERFSTIKSYMQLCPAPKDIEHLLVFKPNYRIQTVDESALLQNPPSELKPLCIQYERLKAHYPVESALLFQAIHALSMTKRLVASTTTKQPVLIPLLTQDPLYEPLRKHRGFLRVWELLEQFFNALVDVFRSKKESTYIQSSCFFKTKTEQLLVEAERSIAHDVAIL